MRIRLEVVYNLRFLVAGVPSSPSEGNWPDSAITLSRIVMTPGTPGKLS
jgi:hypothetical protein